MHASRAPGTSCDELIRSRHRVDRCTVQTARPRMRHAAGHGQRPSDAAAAGTADLAAIASTSTNEAGSTSCETKTAVEVGQCAHGCLLRGAHRFAVMACDHECGELDDAGRRQPLRTQQRNDVGEDLIGLFGDGVGPTAVGSDV